MSHETTIIDINETDNNINNNKPKEKSKKSIWRKASIGAGIGIVLGVVPTAASALFNTKEPLTDLSDDVATNNDEQTYDEENVIISEESIDENSLETFEEEIEPATEEFIVNEGEDEGVSFNEAFNEAREALGPGHSFEWEGRIFSTYTEEEWEVLSDEERDQNCEQAANEYDFSLEEPEVENNFDIQDVVEDSAELDVEVAPSNDIENIEPTIAEPVTESEVAIDVDEQIEIIDTEHQDEVNIIDIEYDDLTGATLAEATVNGEDVVLIDSDNDGIADHIVENPDENDAYSTYNWEKIENPIDLGSNDDFELDNIDDGGVDYSDDF